jgi:hypothetical protein
MSQQTNLTSAPVPGATEAPGRERSESPGSGGEPGWVPDGMSRPASSDTA